MKFKSSINVIRRLIRFSSTSSVFINLTNCNVLSSIPNLSTFNYNWDRVIAQVKQVVNYSSSNFNSKCLLSEEIFKIMQQLNQLVDVDHPIRETAKSLALKENNSIEIRGLIVLLIAKAIGIKCSNNLTEIKLNSITQKQSSLAEMTEMIYSAHRIHREVINFDLVTNCDQMISNQPALSIGNSMSILSGDYLLANVWKGLGQLEDTKVVELMAKSISDFMEGQFIVETKSTDYLEDLNSSIDYWRSINLHLHGSLLANGCQSVAVLANHDSTIQLKAYYLGLSFALAFKSANEMIPYLNNQFDFNQFYPLHSAPALLYFSSTRDNINNYKSVEGKINQRQLYKSIRSSSAIDLTRRLKNSHAIYALELLADLPINEAIKALTKILSTLMTL